MKSAAAINVQTSARTVGAATDAALAAPIRDPAHHVRELMKSAIVGEEQAQWLRTGVLSWLRNGGKIPLATFLGFPAGSRGVRLFRRDLWLREAVRFVQAPTSWQRADLLRRAATVFMARTWPAWHRLSVPPTHATELQGCLFWAANSEPRLPATTKQFHNILASAMETKTADDFPPSVVE